MGCAASKESNETLIQSKEKALKIGSLTVPQIKESFFNLNDFNDISYKNLVRGFEQLNLLQLYSEKTKCEVFAPFVRTFLNESISMTDSTDYNFKCFMAVMFVMSGSSTANKAKGLFRLFDYGNNGAMG